MKMSDLLRETGIPLTTIKFWIRDGLLPDGKKLNRNQTEYGIEHIERIMLIVILRQLFSVDEIKQICSEELVTIAAIKAIREKAEKCTRIMSEIMNIPSADTELDNNWTPGNYQV